MPELVVTLNCLELFSLPPTLSFLGSYSVTWPFTISFSSSSKKGKSIWLQCVALVRPFYGDVYQRHVAGDGLAPL